MKHTHRYIWIAIAITLMALVHATAEADSSRKAAVIIKKHAAAIGGEKRGALRAMKIIGRIEVQGIKAPFTLWIERPNRSRMEMKMMGQTVIQVYDGRRAWWVNPLLGAVSPREMPVDFARETVRWSSFDGPLIDYRNQRNRVRYMGEETLATGPAYKIEIRLANGEKWFSFIDTESLFEVKRSYPVTYRGKSQYVDAYFSDFVNIEGMVTPRIVHGVGVTGDAYVMTFETFDLSVTPDPHRYEMERAE